MMVWVMMSLWLLIPMELLVVEEMVNANILLCF